MDPSDPAYPGQRDYSPAMLAVYDVWVMGIVSRLVWRISPRPALDQYRAHLGARHLDVGPGTGYLLDRTAPPGTRITLLDPNPHVLAYASKRLARLAPDAVEADVLKPLPVSGPFDSIALAHVLHCLPGPMAAKAAAIRNLAAVVAPDGVLFGGTVLGLGERHSRLARGFLRAFNRRGAFDNLDDSVDGLREILAGSFARVEVEVVGSLAYFTATERR